MPFDIYDLSANVNINMADIEVELMNVCDKFGIRALNDYQRKAITLKAIRSINLPTGYGKSRVYLALMKDQVDKSKMKS